ncbi:MAG: D-aminoacyl-tRNA deacylase [Acidimicrobiales bacterium]
MNRSVAAVGGAVLVVSQFTLYGDTRRGAGPATPTPTSRRGRAPGFGGGGDVAELGATVETGRFRTEMAVELVNDGPVTLLVEVEASARPDESGPSRSG